MRRELHVDIELLEAPIAVLRIRGAVDSENAVEIQKALDSTLDRGHDHLALELSGLDFMSTAGWGALVGTLRRVRTRRGCIHLSGLTRDVADVYGLLEFDQLMPCHPDLDEALAAIRAGATL
ncbi:MAG: STAS domain-containing protein [Candidatus Eisenbacteria bacterium]|nr:STAS domain-containing protein [Candidatus Eisenbacteria bacterium]